MILNKNDLIDAISQRADISKTAAENALKAFAECITETLISGGKVIIPRLGVLETKLRAARTGRNPQTGAQMEIPAAIVPKFRAGKGLKDAVNAKSYLESAE